MVSKVDFSTNVAIATWKFESDSMTSIASSVNHDEQFLLYEIEIFIIRHVILINHNQ